MASSTRMSGQLCL